MPRESALEGNTSSGLCYVPYFGWIPAVGFLVFSKDNKVKWNACQSLLMHLLLVAVYFITIPLIKATVILSAVVTNVGGIFGVLFLVAMLYLLVKTHEGEQTRLPVISEWADKMLGFVKS